MSDRVANISHSLLLRILTLKEIIQRLPITFAQYILYMEKYKNHTKIKNLKYQLQRGMKIFNYLMGHIPYHILKIVSRISSKNMK